jgi:hypothetical protein
MQSAHPKHYAPRRLRLRGPRGAKDGFLLAATAQNLRQATHPTAAARDRVRGVSVGAASEASYRPPLQRAWMRTQGSAALFGDFVNEIGQNRTACKDVICHSTSLCP